MKITVPVNVDIEVDHDLSTDEITEALRQEAREPAGSWPRAARLLMQAIQVMRAVPDDIVATAKPEPRSMMRKALEQELARWQELTV